MNISHIGRRRFLQMSAGVVGSSILPGLSTAGRERYQVGVGRNQDPYAATLRALAATSDWRELNVAGKTVVIKPNIVAARTAESGAVTDPEVVRAVVDELLQRGARSIAIVETSPTGAHFLSAGYDFFQSYAADRVYLVDLQDVPVGLRLVPGGGMAYQKLYLANLLMQPDVVFISVAKLKTHIESVVTLSMKNLFGLPAVDRYISTPSFGRFAMHDRGVHQSIIDIGLARPIDFAVIDGIWGMEGAGPLQGEPVNMQTVLAGRNALAVDRVGSAVMEIPGDRVKHFSYAARLQLGPADLDSISVQGDGLVTRPFLLPVTAPRIEYPRVYPRFIVAGESTTIGVHYDEAVFRKLDIRRLNETNSTVVPIRNLRNRAYRPAGTEFLEWNGRDNNGAVVSPGPYAVHVSANSVLGQTRPADAIGRVWVLANGGR